MQRQIETKRHKETKRYKETKRWRLNRQRDKTHVLLVVEKDKETNHVVRNIETKRQRDKLSSRISS